MLSYACWKRWVCIIWLVIFLGLHAQYAPGAVQHFGSTNTVLLCCCIAERQHKLTNNEERVGCNKAIGLSFLPWCWVSYNNWKRNSYSQMRIKSL